jgi:hypothetical protein
MYSPTKLFFKCQCCQQRVAFTDSHCSLDFFWDYETTNGRPEFIDVRIDYHKDIEEMLEHNLILREPQGSLFDPTKSKK